MNNSLQRLCARARIALDVAPRIALGFALLALCAADAQAQQTVRNVPYTQTGGQTGGGQTGDVYRATGSGPFAAIVYIHGGSWRSGGKGVYSKLAADLAAKGYVGFAIDYDLKPKSFPVSWEQALDAVRFLRAHATEYNVDPQRIYVAGDSAGGELAALVALAPAGPAGAGDMPAQAPATVAGALIFNGAFDLHASASVIKRYLGGSCAAMPAACNDASPEDHVHAGAPPFFVGHGTSDRVVPYSEAVRFEAALRKVGVPVTPFVAQGGPHEYWRKSKFYAANLAAVEAFLKHS